MIPNVIQSWEALLKSENVRAKLEPLNLEPLSIDEVIDLPEPNFVSRGYFKLNEDGSVSPASMFEVEGQLQDIESRRIGYSEISYSPAQQRPEKICVSTVFLGLDHGFSGHCALFETLVSRSNDGGDVIDRYATMEEAKAGHLAIVRREAEGQTMRLVNPVVPLICSQQKTKFMPAKIYNPLEE